MPRQIPVTLDDQIAEVKRELALRERIYSKAVLGGRMDPTRADCAFATMRGVLHTLIALQETASALPVRVQMAVREHSELGLPENTGSAQPPLL